MLNEDRTAHLAKVTRDLSVAALCLVGSGCAVWLTSSLVYGTRVLNEEALKSLSVVESSVRRASVRFDQIASNTNAALLQSGLILDNIRLLTIHQDEYNTRAQESLKQTAALLEESRVTVRKLGDVADVTAAAVKTQQTALLPLTDEAQKLLAQGRLNLQLLEPIEVELQGAARQTTASMTELKGAAAEVKGLAADLHTISTRAAKPGSLLKSVGTLAVEIGYKLRVLIFGGK